MANTRVKDLTVAYSADTTDFEDLDSNSLGSRGVSPFNKAAQFGNAKSPRNGLYCVGANGSGGVTVGSLLSFAGSDPFSVVFTIKPGGGTADRIFWYGSSESDSINIRYNPTTRAMTSGTTGSGLSYTAPDNKPAIYVLGRTGTGSNQAFLYRNGILVLTFTDSQVYNAASYSLSGNGSAAGAENVWYGFSFYNFGLTAADIQDLMERGGGVPEWLQWGSQTAQGQTDFSGGTTGWTTQGQSFQSAPLSSISDGTTSLSNVYELYADGSTGLHSVINSYATITRRTSKFRLRFRYYIPSGQTNVNGFNLGTTGAAGDLSIVTGTQSFSTVGTWTTVDQIIQCADTSTPGSAIGGLRFFISLTKNGATSFTGANSSSDDRIYLAYFYVNQVGATCNYRFDEGAGLIAYDRTGNGLHGTIRSTGTAWLFPDGGVPGTGTNDNAVAGQVGELMTARQAGGGSALSMSNGAGLNVTSLSLTAGDWDVSGVVAFIPQSTTIRGRCIAGISTASTTIPTNTDDRGQLTLNTADSTGNDFTVAAPVQRISIAATTTVYLVGYSDFSSGTMKAYGTIRARRVR